MSRNKLNNKERDFFSLVDRAVCTNPFSDTRIDIELQIAGLFPDATKLERGYKTIKEVETRLENLKRQGKGDFNTFSGHDRHLVRNAHLYLFFYRFRKKFDRLIRKQIKAGDQPVKPDFYEEALSSLRKSGFDQEDSLRYFGLYYQFRRAFYFITQSLIGNSDAMKKLRLNLWDNVFTHNVNMYDKYLWNRMEDFSTLILGGTGTGKGTAAMAIGRSGFIPFDEKSGTFVESFTHSFVSLNLSGFPESLIESELFGHKKGAFTGAVEDYPGILARCSPNGSILLDEIGEVSIPVQIKLLQVLQDRIFYPVGSHKPGRFQGRVIAATNRTLDEIRSGDTFRKDFYYRLCSDIIMVPSLQERISEDPTELDDLLAFTVNKMVGMPSPELAQLAKDVILKKLGMDYEWPGNVRELEQCVRSIILKQSCMAAGETESSGLSGMLAEGMKRGSIDAQKLLAGYCKLLYEQHGTFEKVARRTKLDRRTVKKHITEWDSSNLESS